MIEAQMVEAVREVQERPAVAPYLHQTDHVELADLYLLRDVRDLLIIKQVGHRVPARAAPDVPEAHREVRLESVIFALAPVAVRRPPFPLQQAP